MKSLKIIFTIAGVLFAVSLIFPQSAYYPKSQLITGISFDFSTKKILAPGSDNWAITWADDGHQYTTWGDGGGFGGTNDLGRVLLGYARVEGGKSNYTGTNIWGGYNAIAPATFGGKSVSVLSVSGVLYTFRNGNSSNGSAFRQTELYSSSDHFLTLNYANVRWEFPSTGGLFCPSFCQFGQDYQGARDNYVYIYAPINKNDVWDVQKPGEIILIRVSKTALAQTNQYEYFAGMSGSTPAWSNSPGAAAPVFSDPVNGVMRTSVSYNPVLKQYLLITQQVSRYKNNNAHIGIYEGPAPWGPWSTVLFENPYSTGLMRIPPPSELTIEVKTVFWNFSNKWLSSDGLRFVLVYTDYDTWTTMEGDFIVPDQNDSTPPEIVSVACNGDPKKVTVTFSESMDRSSCETAANYSINNGVQVTSAVLSFDERVVTLTTSSHSLNTNYTLTVNNVTDASDAKNRISPNSTAGYQYLEKLIITLNTYYGTATAPIIVEDGFIEGADQVNDRSGAVWAGIPSTLSGSTYLLTARDDKNNGLDENAVMYELTVSAACSVYALIDNAVTAPAWIASDGWQPAAGTLTGDGKPYSIYVKYFPTGSMDLKRQKNSAVQGTGFVFKTADNGPTVEAFKSALKIKHFDLTISPNPCSASTQFRTEYRGKAELSLYTIAGQLMTHTVLTQNNKVFTWHAGHAAPGFYVAELKSAQGKISKRFLIIK